MNRILHVFITFLILLSAPVGTNAQTAVFDSSVDDIKVFSVYTSAQEINPICFSETKLIERIQIRSQKRSDSSQNFLSELFLSVASFPSVLLAFQKLTLATARVLLLPKSLKNVIFLQTLI